MVNDHPVRDGAWSDAPFKMDPRGEKMKLLDSDTWNTSTLIWNEHGLSDNDILTKIKEAIHYDDILTRLDDTSQQWDDEVKDKDKLTLTFAKIIAVVEEHDRSVKLPYQKNNNLAITYHQTLFTPDTITAFQQEGVFRPQKVLEGIVHAMAKYMEMNDDITPYDAFALTMYRGDHCINP